MKFLEKKLPAGVEFLAILFIAAPISRGMAMLMDPLVNATLGKIGSMISVATTESPIIMGIMLGGLITVISTSTEFYGTNCNAWINRFTYGDW